MNHILLTLFMIPLFFSSEKPETVRTLPAENKNVITTKDAVKIR